MSLTEKVMAFAFGTTEELRANFSDYSSLLALTAYYAECVFGGFSIVMLAHGRLDSFMPALIGVDGFVRCYNSIKKFIRKEYNTAFDHPGIIGSLRER